MTDLKLLASAAAAEVHALMRNAKPGVPVNIPRHLYEAIEAARLESLRPEIEAIRRREKRYSPRRGVIRLSNYGD
jgi:hypothetical protein